MSKVNGNDIKVAIKCLVYNHEPYLRDCLEGFVMQQTDFPFVAIVHDDASTDHSADIIREYAAKYPDIIHPIYETENQYSKKDGSLTKIMNAAIEATGAPYIAICEGDDFWTNPHKLQKQVDFLETHPDIGLCYTDYDTCDAKGTIINKACFANGINKIPVSFAEHLVAQGYIAPMTWLYRKTVYDALQDIQRQPVVDGSFVVALEFFLHSAVYFVNEVTATYRIHEGSASRPLTVAQWIKYRKGVYEIQQQYAKQDSETLGLLPIFKVNEILELLPLALEADLNQYIDEYNAKAEDLHLDTNLCVMVFRFKKDARDARSSYAYRLGKFLLKPFRWIRLFISKNRAIV
ncbi:MAG: glycosyltransferase [Bacteroidales bacterium]|nr:glycosyltransferase [Bacteroidales bacterium]